MRLFSKNTQKQQVHVKPLFIINNYGTNKCNRFEAVKEYTKCSLTDQTYIALYITYSFQSIKFKATLLAGFISFGFEVWRVTTMVNFSYFIL